MSPVAHRNPASLSPALSWFELFYDLVFVASIVVLSNAFSHHPSWPNALWVAGVFSLIWMVWLLTVLQVNQFQRDDVPQRGLVLLQMFLVTLVAVAAGDGLPTHSRLVGPLAGSLLVLTAIMYARPPRRSATNVASREARGIELRVAGTCGAGALCFMVAPLAPGRSQYLLWLAAGILTLIPMLVLIGGRNPALPAIDHPHLIERMGAFTIIVCGESFVKVALTAADGTLDGVDLWVMAFEFLLVFSVWWAYFDDVPEAGMPPRGPHRAGWVAGHLPLQLALVGVAVGASKYIVSATEQSLSVSQLVSFAVPLAGTYAALALIGWSSPRTRPRHLGLVRLVTAAIIGLIALGWWQGHPAGAEGLFAALAVVAVVHAVLVSTMLIRSRRDQPEPATADAPRHAKDH